MAYEDEIILRHLADAGSAHFNELIQWTQFPLAVLREAIGRLQRSNAIKKRWLRDSRGRKTDSFKFALQEKRNGTNTRKSESSKSAKGC